MKRREDMVEKEFKHKVRVKKLDFDVNMQGQDDEEENVFKMPDLEQTMDDDGQPEIK